MIEIECPAELLHELRGRRSPLPVADPLAPSLGVLHAVGEQIGVRRSEHEVVELAVGLLADPLPFSLVVYRAASLMQDPARARVHHDHAIATEVAVEAPPDALAIL